jgi:hypothetical protein
MQRRAAGGRSHHFARWQDPAKSEDSRPPMDDTPRTFLDRRPPSTTCWDAHPEPEQQLQQPALAPAAQLARGSEPLDALSTALLTDMYQITMAYSYWFNERHNGKWGCLW